MNPILEKIKKLLRMKRGGTPDEIATALRLAQELAEKHGIDLTGVNPDDDNARPERPISHIDAILGARIQWECRYAALICHCFFHVNTFTRWHGAFVKEGTWNRGAYCITFVGTAWDTEIAIYVYNFLVGHFRREWKTRRGRCRNRQAFMYGMYLGISSKLRERQPATVQQSGIIQVDRQLQRRNDYLATNFGELTSNSVTPDGDAAAARNRGWVAGRETEIRPAVTTKKDDTLLLT